MEILTQHHALNDDRDKEVTEEDVHQTFLSILGYAAQSLEMGVPAHKVARYLRSERERLFDANRR